MTATRVVSATRPGRADRPNEDYVAVNTNDGIACAVLLDGAGGPAELPNGCGHGTPWYVHQLGDELIRTMSAQDAALPDILSQAIAHVAELHADTCDLNSPGTPSSTVVMTRITDTVEYLVLSDSTLIIDIDSEITALSDTRIEEIGTDERKRMNAHPTETPEHQAARIELVTLQREARNQDGGFWVAATDPAAAKHANAGTIPQARRLALLSDGATRFVEFGLGSWVDLLGILDAHGPDRLFDRVREAEASDPHGEQWPRVKHRDDIAAIYIDMTGDAQMT